MTQTLRELLEKLKKIDDDLAPDDFNPQEIVGDLRDKVDAIKWRVDEWNKKAEMIENEWIAPLHRKKESLLKKSQKLLEYVREEMQRNNFETLPGEVFRMDLQKSTPSVEVNTEASAAMFVAYPMFVKQKVVYAWDKKSIKEHLDNGKALLFADLKPGSHIRFYAKED